MTVLDVSDRADDPEAFADTLDLDLADVYAALAYYHAHEAEMDRHRRARERAGDDLRVRVERDRPAGVRPDEWRPTTGGSSSTRTSIRTSWTRFGIDAEWVPDVLDFGADDLDDILPYFRETRTVLVTDNLRDFDASDLSFDDHAGIVIVHEEERPPEEIAAELHPITVA